GAEIPGAFAGLEGIAAVGVGVEQATVGRDARGDGRIDGRGGGVEVDDGVRRELVAAVQEECDARRGLVEHEIEVEGVVLEDGDVAGSVLQLRIDAVGRLDSGERRTDWTLYSVGNEERAELGERDAIEGKAAVA